MVWLSSTINLFQLEAVSESVSGAVGRLSSADLSDVEAGYNILRCAAVLPDFPSPGTTFQQYQKHNMSMQRFATRFVALPIELQLNILELLPGWGEDAVDGTITPYCSEATCPVAHAAKAWSIMLAHPNLFDHMYPIVLQKHPIVFYNINDLMQTISSIPVMRDGARRLHLAFGDCHPTAVRTALGVVACMPNVRSVEIDVAETVDLTDDILKLFCAGTTVRALDQIIVRKPGMEQRLSEFVEELWRERLIADQLAAQGGLEDLRRSVEYWERFVIGGKGMGGIDGLAGRGSI